MSALRLGRRRFATCCTGLDLLHRLFEYFALFLIIFFFHFGPLSEFFLQSFGRSYLFFF